jgi:hypothetical protein
MSKWPKTENKLAQVDVNVISEHLDSSLKGLFSNTSVN